MNHPTPKRLLAALAAGLLLTACTSSTDIPKTIETPILTDASQIDLPLLDYFPSVEEQKLIHKGTRRYQEQCAQRFGVTLSPDEVNVFLSKDLLVGRRYGLLSREEAKAHGFEPRYGAEGDEDDKKETETSPKQALEDEVMTGKASGGFKSTLKDSKGNPLPEGGCGKEGWDRLRGDIPYDYDELPDTLLGEAVNLMRADPRFQEAEKDWSDCMRKAGYEFEHTWDAGNSVAGEDIETQKALALVNVNCSLEVNYPGRAMAVDVEYQRKLIKENEAQLRDVLDTKNKLLDNAKEAFK